MCVRLQRAATAKGERGIMSEHKDLWDYLETAQPHSALQNREAAETRAALQDQEDRERTRQATIKKLRASGHWLTLLRVARTIPQPFTLNDISVAVWRACPDFFGMKGYPYPDNHKVHYILYGDRGLIAKGMIRRVSQGLFCVPEGLDPEQFLKAEQEAASANEPEA